MVIVPGSALEPMKLGAIGGLASLTKTNRISDPCARGLWHGCAPGAVPAGTTGLELMSLSPPILMPAKEFADLWRAAAAAPPLRPRTGPRGCTFPATRESGC